MHSKWIAVWTSGTLSLFALGSVVRGAPPGDAGPRECPWHEDSARTVPVSVVGETAKIPEYNDCQRFVVPVGPGASKLKFDSLYAIYWGGLANPLQSDGIARLGALVRSFGGGIP